MNAHVDFAKKDMQRATEIVKVTLSGQKSTAILERKGTKLQQIIICQ